MRTVIAIAALGVSAGAAAAQNIVVNGGFESPVVLAPWVQRIPGESFGGWTVDSVNQGIVHVASFGRPSPAEGAQSVELNFYQSCGISQVVATTPGAHYRLSFMMAGQTDAGPNVKHMRIDWNGSPVATATWDRAVNGIGWEPHSYNLVATGVASTLHFYGLEEVDGGPYLDAVSIVPTCGVADLGSTGGVQQPDGLLDNNDFVAFIDAFFAHSALADLGSTGGVAGSDGVWDNNDFVAFIDAFFSGCS